MQDDLWGGSSPHDHIFLGPHHARNERRTQVVIGLTLAMMIGEIVGGTVFHSLALLADGWHMATHAGALGIAALAYRYARNHASDPRFCFGTGKIGDLAAFASALILGIVAALIAWESARRLASPVGINFREATWVAALGLVVNLASAWLLQDAPVPGHEHADDAGHGHAHEHPPDHDHDHSRDHKHEPETAGKKVHHADHNLRAAYVHVLTDAITSVLAIAGLLAGALFGWIWMDAVMALVGALVIARWSVGLMRDTGAVLLDATVDPQVVGRLRKVLERDGARICDLHVWRIGPGHFAAAVSIIAVAPRPLREYHERLLRIPGLSHVTVEASASGPA